MINVLTLTFWGLSFCFGGPNPFLTLHHTDVPAVFLLVHSDRFDKELATAHPVTLLRVFDNNTQESFRFWRTFSQSIQTAVKNSKPDPPSTQIWVKAYWDEHGRLIHIGYSLDSKRQQDPAWDNLFLEIIARSEAKGSWSKGFYHFGCIKLI